VASLMWMATSLLAATLRGCPQVGAEAKTAEGTVGQFFNLATNPFTFDNDALISGTLPPALVSHGTDKKTTGLGLFSPSLRARGCSSPQRLSSSFNAAPRLQVSLP
jgi:hypothetical protein